MARSTTLMTFLNVSLLVCLLTATAAAAYDVGCIYPEQMPDPIEAYLTLSKIIQLRANIEPTETPVVIYGGSVVSQCGPVCVSFHDAEAINPVTMTAPAVRVPEFGHNSYSRMMCIAQCARIVVSTNEFLRDNLTELYDEWGLETRVRTPNSLISAAISATLGGESGLETLEKYFEERDWSPISIGQLAAYEVASQTANDGWNNQGTLGYSEETKEATRCTVNCIPFQDTTGYKPVNPPMINYDDPDAKYRVEGDQRRWQPLLEGMEGAIFQRQDHVTPHIGTTARTYLMQPGDKYDEKLDDPMYDYYEEAKLVVERMYNTSLAPASILRQIQFMDNKQLPRRLIEYSYLQQYNVSFEELVNTMTGLHAVEHDTVVLSWREKVRHDLVRPTTVIKRWGEDYIVTGQLGEEGPQTIKAKDFEAFHRVMPHSEFPSGSACICTGYQEYMDAVTMDVYGSKITNLRVGPNAANGEFGLNCDAVAPGLLKPGQAFGCEEDDTFEFSDLNDLKYVCGQSRLWGGMHFTASVPAAEEQCSGLGELGLEYAKKIRNNSSFGQMFFAGQARPICATPGSVAEKNN